MDYISDYTRRPSITNEVTVGRGKNSPIEPERIQGFSYRVKECRPTRIDSLYRLCSGFSFRKRDQQHVGEMKNGDSKS